MHRNFRIGTLAVLAVAVLPVAMTSRCELGAWQIAPVACWWYSAAGLVERVKGNMGATRGFPFTIIRVDHWPR